MSTGSTSTRRRSARAVDCARTRRRMTSARYQAPAPQGDPSAAPARLSRRGGACRPCPSSIPTTRSCASTCWARRSIGCASASTAGGWTCRGDRCAASGASSASGCRAVNPDAYIVAEIWREAGMADRRHLRRADELPADRGAPVASSARPSLDTRRRRRRSNEYRESVRPIDGAEFAGDLAAPDDEAVPAADRLRAAQPAGQPRHGALPDASPAAIWRRCARAARRS